MLTKRNVKAFAPDSLRNIQVAKLAQPKMFARKNSRTTCPGVRSDPVSFNRAFFNKVVNQRRKQLNRQLAQNGLRLDAH